MVDWVPPEAEALLRAHLADLEARLRPGELVLTWASLNVDGFLYQLEQVRPAVARPCPLILSECTQQYSAVAR